MLEEFFMEDDMALNEAYFGESNETRELLELISEIRRVVNTKSNLKINNTKEVENFNRYIEKMFGFNTFTLTIIPDYTYNAFTMPIANQLDAVNPNKKLTVSKYGGFRFGENNYTVMTFITTGMLKDTTFTDREVAAILLHEVGHSFTTAYTKNSIIGNMNKLLLTSTILEQTIRKSVETGSIDLSGLALFGPYKKALNGIDRAMRKIPLMSEILDGMTWLGSSLNNFSKELSYPFQWMNVIMGAAITTPLQAINNFFNFRLEQQSDNFATAYGFGPELGSALIKMEKDDGGLIMSKKIRKNFPAISNSMDNLTEMSKFILHPISTHPTTVSRLINQIDMLENEIKKTDLDPKLKKSVEKDLEDLNKILKANAVPAEKTNSKDDYFIKKMYAGAMMRYVNGGDIRNSFYNDEKSFYDLDRAFMEKNEKRIKK